MEKKIYEKILDNRGNYFISLGSNTEKINSVIHLITRVNNNLADKYFNRLKLAAYFIYFSLFSYNEVLEFDRMLFLYSSKTKRFHPFLTLDSVLASLFEQDIGFKLHIGEAENFFTKPTAENIYNLLSRADRYKYEELIKIALTDP